MKVYFVHSGLQGCYVPRCLLPLIANGWDGDQTSIYPEKNTPENKSRAAQDAEVIVFHRPEQAKKLELALMLKKLGKKIVFDNDDTYKDLDGMKFNEYMNEERVTRGIATVNRTIDAFIAEADLVTCSTEFLAEEYRKLNPNVVVLPNYVDPFYYDEPLRNETDTIRIGITGSVAVSGDLEVLIPILRHYEQDKRVKLVVFSLPPGGNDSIARKLYAEEYKIFDSMDIEWQPFVNAYEYPEKLNELKLDIMIIPRKDSYFNRCKSNIKFLESSLLEIPVIAQGFADGKSPYQVNPEDAKHMIIVTDNSQWIPEIEKLIADKQLRFDMGKKAHEYVLANYDINKNADKWVKAYETLYGSTK